MNTPAVGAWDRVEQQFQEVATLLASGDALQLQTASATLQALSRELALVLQSTPTPSNKLLRERVKRMAQGLQMLRDNLSRQAAFTQQSLQVVLPRAVQSTYKSGASVYGARLGDFKA